jgi:hypothetical protein
VSPFCIGMVSTPDAICEAYDAGINFFFVTADMHWPLYENTRRGLKALFDRGRGIREEIVVAVVSYNTQPEFCHMPFQELVNALPGLERIDVALAGGAYANDVLARLLVYHFKHRRQAYLGTRAIGASFHDRVAGLMLTNHNLVDIGFIRYNPGHPGARDDSLPYRDPRSPALLYGFKSVLGHISTRLFQDLGLDDSYWWPKPTDHYRFVLTRPEFDGLLCSPSTPEMVREMAEAMNEGPLDAEEEQYMIDLAQSAQAKELGLLAPDQ